jgi:hypothetical protein
LAGGKDEWQIAGWSFRVNDCNCNRVEPTFTTIDFSSFKTETVVVVDYVASSEAAHECYSKMIGLNKSKALG